MRQVFLFWLFSLLFLKAGAQIGFAPEAGIGISYMHFEPDPSVFTSSSTKPIISGRLGGTIDVNPGKAIYVQSGIFLSRKGQNRNYSFFINDSFNEAINQKLTINYFDVPINVLYKTGVQGTGRFFFGLGATLSYIVGGRDKIHAQGKFNDTPFVADINNKVVADETLKGFDLGVNLTAGYELPTGLFFRAYWILGANDIGLGFERDKNRMAGISAGFFLGKGRNVNREAADLIDTSQ